MQLLNFTIWYDIVINGLVVGFFIFLAGLRAKESWMKMKTIGGGTGIATCCVVANAAMLSGAFIVSSVFQFLAPIIIIGALLAGRRMQRQKMQAEHLTPA